MILVQRSGQVISILHKPRITPAFSSWKEWRSILDMILYFLLFFAAFPAFLALGGCLASWTIRKAWVWLILVLHSPLVVVVVDVVNRD